MIAIDGQLMSAVHALTSSFASLQRNYQVEPCLSSFPAIVTFKFLPKWWQATPGTPTISSSKKPLRDVKWLSKCNSFLEKNSWKLSTNEENNKLSGNGTPHSMGLKEHCRNDFWPMIRSHWYSWAGGTISQEHVLRHQILDFLLSMTPSVSCILATTMAHQSVFLLWAFIPAKSLRFEHVLAVFLI